MQLGKLDGSQSAQDVGHKTPDNTPQVDQGVITQKQNAQQGDATHTFPRIISQWDRNKREVIRVELDHYNGRHIVGIRVWYRDGDDLKPSRTGLTVSVKHLAPLATALAVALNVAQDAGLLDEGEQ